MTERALIKELWSALRAAEIALCNAVPVAPYKGDGPLVGIRGSIQKAEVYLANSEHLFETEEQAREFSEREQVPTKAETTLN